MRANAGLVAEAHPPRAFSPTIHVVGAYRRSFSIVERSANAMVEVACPAVGIPRTDPALARDLSAVHAGLPSNPAMRVAL
jgi:hypothetical protein